MLLGNPTLFITTITIVVLLLLLFFYYYCIIIVLLFYHFIIVNIYNLTEFLVLVCHILTYHVDPAGFEGHLI